MVKKESQKLENKASKTSEVFDFESEESPPQASNEEQSRSLSDDEQLDGSKKWIEMQFQQNDAKLYEVEYERGPLEDIKEEEVCFKIF